VVIKGYILHNLRLVSEFPSKPHFWRTKDKSEVDFIIEKGKTIVPVETKFSTMKKPEITRSLRNFIGKYKPEKAIVANLSLEEKIKMKLPTTLRSGYLLPALRRERNPSRRRQSLWRRSTETKFLRFHPRTYVRGISRRGINTTEVIFLPYFKLHSQLSI